MIGKVGVDLHWLLTGEGEPLVQARAKAEPTPAAEINVEALAAIIAAVDYANPKAHPSERAAVAAQAYATSIREGLITPTGPGQRAPKNAA